MRLYDQDNPEVSERIQPQLTFRQWDDIDSHEKERMFELLIKNNYLKNNLSEAGTSIAHLNNQFMRLLPGENLHKYQVNEIKDSDKLTLAVRKDFKHIFLHGKPQDLVFIMLSAFATNLIDKFYFEHAHREQDSEIRGELVDKAFYKLDRLAKRLKQHFRAI